MSYCRHVIVQILKNLGVQTVFWNSTPKYPKRGIEKDLFFPKSCMRALTILQHLQSARGPRDRGGQRCFKSFWSFFLEFSPAFFPYSVIFHLPMSRCDFRYKCTVNFGFPWQPINLKNVISKLIFVQNMRWYCVVRFFKECVLKKVMCHFVYCVYVLYVCVGVCMYVCIHTYMYVPASRQLCSTGRVILEMTRGILE